MIDDKDILALLGGRHGDPFAVLGLHADGDGRLWIRALLPGASEVRLVDAHSDRPLCSLPLRHTSGFFECAVPRRRKVFDYLLEVRWADGNLQRMVDAYSFGPQLRDEEMFALRDGRHPRPYTVLGAHLQQQRGVDGVRFALWAPNARRVSVVGDFNSWDGRRHAMRLRHAAGIWEIFVPHVAIGERYKFELVGPAGELLPLKADPYAFAAELRPDTASRVAALPAAQRLPPQRGPANARAAAISIYEVHAPSWRHAADGNFPSWDELAATLPAYAADLGFTHVELMPISEHPFDGSWGYQALGLYAPSARFGSPEGFARFVQACHARGLGVLLDWVPAHFPSDAHGLARFDGTALYEYADPREGFHRDWNTLIYNFGRNEVRDFLAGNALYWLERYGVDGLRVDAVASMIYRDYSRPAGEWIANAAGGRENLEAISLLRRINETVGADAQGAITLAEESTAFPGVSAPTSVGGLGFHYKWNMGWMNDTLQYMHEDPVHRRWHHDKMSFGMVYAYSENFVLPLSHDEVVHGKGSLIGKMPGDRWQQLANLRAFFAYMWAHPGKQLLFMGSELAQSSEWSEGRSLDWWLLDYPEHRGVQACLRDMNRIYREHSALWSQDHVPAGFEWIDANDAIGNVYSWIRWGSDGSAVAVIINFSPMVKENYRIGLPMAGTWTEILNTDAAAYGGSGVGNLGAVVAQGEGAHGLPTAATMVIPPLAAVWLRWDD